VGVVRWGLWGTGRISHQVAQDLHLVAGARVTMVGGRRLDAAQRLAALHPGAAAVNTLEQIVSSDQVDAVYIATPDGRHHDDALLALAAGKAVLCEKPLAASLADVKALLDAARRHKVFLMEAMWMRFLPAIREIKRRVDAGEIGAVRFMQGSFGYADLRRGHEPYANLAQSMLYDRGIYLIALAQSLQAGEVAQAHARGIEWDGRALMKFDLRCANGALLAGACGNAGDLVNGFEIVGERGSIFIPGPFFKAHQFFMRALPTMPAAGEVAVRDARASSWMASAKQWKRGLQWLPQAVNAARAPQFNFKGNGYQFQFEEVARCLAAGRTQSDVMSWADSLALARALQATSDASENSTRP
jgi:predicted dehydrogenase